MRNKYNYRQQKIKLNFRTALIPKIYFLYSGQKNEVTNMDGTGLWTDSKPEVTDKSLNVHLRRKCATNVARCWQKRNSDQFSSDEYSPTYKRGELLQWQISQLNFF